MHMPDRALLVALLLVTPTLAGCSTPGPGPSVENPIRPCGDLDQSYEPEPQYNPRVRMNTTNDSMTILLYGRQVPFTAGHFLRLAEDDTYEDTRFHRLIPNELIMGGDPRTRSEERRAWGTGGYNFRVVDQFHQFLRHDEPGIVSLNSPRPNSGGSQFVITLAPQPQMNDRYPVFGKVIDGMQTARELSRTPTDDQARPIQGAYLHNVTRLPTPVSQAPPPELTAYGYDCVDLAEPGDTAEYLLALRNTGQRVLNGTFETSLADVDGWNATVRNADRIVTSSGQTVAYPVNVSVPETASLGDERTFRVTFRGQAPNVSASLNLTTRVERLGEPALERDEVQIRYVGVLEDGRAFATTVPVYAEEAPFNWFKRPPTDPSPATLPISPETLNQSQPGRLVERARLGETVVGIISPENAYGTQTYGENNLGGRVLIFQVQVTRAS